MTLPEAILHKSTRYENRLVGAKAGGIDSITAGKMAVLISAEAPRLRPVLGPGATDRGAIAYFCACMFQESRFDPNAWALNIKKWEIGLIAKSVAQKPPWPPALDRGDYGAAQFNMVTAMERQEFQGMSREDVMSVLFTPDWAVHAMTDRYYLHLSGAPHKYPLVDRRDAAAGSYNRGSMGFACGYAWKFNTPYPPTATPAHTARAPQYWLGAERHFTKIRQHREWFDQHLD